MTTQNVIKVNIHRNQVGKIIPFDTMYFVPKEREELIPKLFKYAIVLPAEKKMLHKIALHTRPTYFKEVSDAHVDQTWIEGDHLDWWNSFIEEQSIENRLVVIPILVRKARKKLSPRYLSSCRWWVRYGNNDVYIQDALNHGQLKKPIPEAAYLVTPLKAPHDKIQPICNICKRSMSNLTGKCSPGMPICYKTLDLNNILSVDEGEDEDASVQ